MGHSDQDRSTQKGISNQDKSMNESRIEKWNNGLETEIYWLEFRKKYFDQDASVVN